MGRVRGATRTALALGMLALSGSACGNDADQQGNSDPDGYVGETASLLVKANETAELAVGAVKLKVPEGALESDTELQVKVVSGKDLPASKDIALDVYEFGPDGLNFKMPAELEFDVSKVSVDKDKQHIDVAVLDKSSNTWTVIPPTTDAKPGKLSAKISHFSLYTVIFSPNSGPGPAPGPGQCGADFSPCGGNLVGSWNFTKGCITAPPAALGLVVPSDFEACSVKPAAAVGIGVSGTVSFGDDGSYNLNQTVVLNPMLQIGQTCLDELSEAQGMPVACADVQGVAMGEACVRGLQPQSIPNMTGGTYTTDTSGALHQVETGKPASTATASYCIIGDVLTIRIERPSEQRVDTYTAQRL